MPRIILIPTRTADGRHVILRAAVVSPVQSLLAGVRRAFGRPAVG
ncbi:MAG TPA: hypothetical protein VI006_13660 [Solirubrobacteraceae bacterium]